MGLVGSAAAWVGSLDRALSPCPVASWVWAVWVVCDQDMGPLERMGPQSETLLGKCWAGGGLLWGPEAVAALVTLGPETYRK